MIPLFQVVAAPGRRARAGDGQARPRREQDRRCRGQGEARPRAGHLLRLLRAALSEVLRLLLSQGPVKHGRRVSDVRDHHLLYRAFAAFSFHGAQVRAIVRRTSCFFFPKTRENQCCKWKRGILHIRGSNSIWLKTFRMSYTKLALLWCYPELFSRKIM